MSLFVDGSKKFCVLHEVRDSDNNGFVDLGLGTLIVDLLPIRNLVHQAPYPDSGTETLAVSIMRLTNSRAFLMGGTHRNASANASSCQSDFAQSDPAHNVQSGFHAATAAIQSFLNATFIQWLGLEAGTVCTVDVILSHGVNSGPLPSDKIALLAANISAFQPTWRVGNGTCSSAASSNVQGRMLNGVTSVCSTPATMYSQAFVHVETLLQDAMSWMPIIQAAFQPMTPGAPSNVEAICASDGNAAAHSLKWTPVAGAAAYEVLRNTSTGFSVYASVQNSTWLDASQVRV